jgi:hypothetical protein
MTTIVFLSDLYHNTDYDKNVSFLIHLDKIKCNIFKQFVYSNPRSAIAMGAYFHSKVETIPFHKYYLYVDLSCNQPFFKEFKLPIKKKDMFFLETYEVEQTNILFKQNRSKQKIMLIIYDPLLSKKPFACFANPFFSTHK